MSINSISFDEELYNKRRESAVTNFTSFQESFNSWSENEVEDTVGDDGGRPDEPGLAVIFC